MKLLIVLEIFHILQICFAQYNDYSSFLSSNASLAVVVDQEYMRQHNENIMAHFQKILSDTIRENLKNGGLNVKYFTWSGIRLKKEFLAAMTVMDCETTWKFFETTRSSSVLLISITDSDCPRLPLNEAIMIPSVGISKEFPQMMLDAKVQKLLKWKTAIVMMDETIVNQNTKLVESVVHEGTNNIVPIALYLYGINDQLRSQKKRQAIREALQPFQTNSQDSHNFIIFSKFYEDIIEVAENMNMFHAKNQWLFFVLEEHRRDFDALAVTQNLQEGTNIAFVLNETTSDCVISLNCTIEDVSRAFVSSISKLITEEQSIYGEISDEEWEALRYSKSEKQNEILRIMKEYLKDHSRCESCSKWRIDTAINWGKSQEHKRTLRVSSNSPNRNFEFTNVGYWSPLLGFVTQDLAFPHAIHHFRNITLDILTVHNPPWQILKKDSRGNIIEHSGIVMEIVKELSRMLNFSYKLHDAHAITNDEQMGQNETDLLGTLTYIIPYQVVELLQSNKFFMAAVAATVDEPDKKHFNYTIPISIQKYSFLSRKPDEVSRIYLFTAPFTLETWASLIGVILITSPVLYVINRLVPTQHLKVKGFCTIKNCFWYIYGALLQQGGMYLPQADSGRLVIGFWWIVVIVLVTTYCGNLVAFLTFPKFQPGLDYFFQLFKHGEYEQLGLRNGTFFEKYAMTSTRNEFHKYLELATIYNNMKEENIEAVKDGERVNIDWRINLQLIIQNHFEKDKECKFALGKENFLDEQIALMVPSNSPYLNLINEQITRLSQMGFIERWHQTNLPSMDKCNGRGVLRQITNHKVNLDDMQGCFLVLLLGKFFN
ncbi:ionotropic receptor 93a [Lucilia sericata]|uniref:ionotropic receptor 93a n=1 Tax=Lucilia sericata TaxID=13632 RepID=UPI0018A87AA0|nr:ionotropic receptor 93a [Lucilia sericata]